MGTFDTGTKGRIIRAVKSAAASISEAALELLECGEYDFSDEAADIFEALEKIRKRIEKEETEE